MREKEIPVKFEPQGRTIYVLENTKIVEAAGRAGITINAPCGGQGTCGKCRVRVLENPCAPTEAERARLSQEELDKGIRLACQTVVCAPVTVEVPETSVMASTYQILSQVAERTVEKTDPAVRKRYVELSRPSREDPRPDLLRIEDEVGPFKVGLPLLRELPRLLRGNDFKGTAVISENRLICFEQGNTENQCYGLAFDIGTTTMVGALLDLCTGVRLAMTSSMNPQTSQGDDVLSRIQHVRENDKGLDRLRESVIADVNRMVDDLLSEAKVERNQVYEATFAGNTTMQQLLQGVSPAALGEVPFVPVAGRSLLELSADLGLNIHPRGRVFMFPVIGGFLGGDTVAGMLATELDSCAGPTLLVDIGTNGEIVVVRDGELVATSTAAGPAFEGARITYGMRASRGAIEKVVIDGDVRINVIGNAPPVGLCGSALIDATAGLLKSGVLMSQGLLLAPEDMPDDVPEALRRRSVPHESGRAFVLANEEETGRDEPVLLTQQDIRELQLATAAIKSGIYILLERLGLPPNALDRVLIAGGFGNFIRRSNARRIGLLPREVEATRNVFVGNTSLAGAQLAAVSQQARLKADELARRTRHIDLSLDPMFQMAFIEGMSFPEGQ